VYLAAPLAVLHYIWLVKSDYREPLLFGAAVALLLALRLPAVRQRAQALRERLRPRSAPSSPRTDPRP
jgi:sulfoxide reductase heme-binding subunit YedZ